jgi:iron complex outermembrane receptor protein
MPYGVADIHHRCARMTLFLALVLLGWRRPNARKPPMTRLAASHRLPTPTPRFALRPLPMLVALAFTGLARAQGAAPADAAPAAPDAGRLQTVTVTAEHVVENVKDVPISVSTLGGDTLDALNASGDDIRALAGRVPSLNIESSFGRAFPRFYIRGYGNTDFHLNASQPVSLVYDDVVQENPILKGFPVFDVNDVEVLAGPQGTLFGRNTPAGVVKVDSVAPSRIAGGYASASWGRFNTINLEGAYGMPLGPDWAIRGSALLQHRDDWVTNTAPTQQTHKLEGYDDEAGRLQLLYKPSGTFSALFNVHGRDLNGTARLFRANIIQPGTDNLVAGFDPYQVAIDGANKQTLDTEGASARLRWLLGDVTLHSITGWEHVQAFSRGDVDGGYGASYDPPMGPGTIPFADETSDAIHGHEQLTQELRAEFGGAGPLTGQAGLYLFHEQYRIHSLTYDTLFHGPDTENDAQQHNNAWAVFGSVNWQVARDLKLRGGLRYTRDRKTLDTIPVSDTAVDKSQGLSTSTDDGRFSWDTSATWALTPDVNAYARVATGFRASSIFPASDFNPLSSARPETNLSYELGVKADLFGKRARLSADAFHYDVKDMQVSAVGGSSNKTELLSVRKAMGQGVELNLDAYLTPNLLVTVNGSVNVTRMLDHALPVGVCGNGCTVTDPTRTITVTNPDGSTTSTTVADTYGNPLPQAPKYVANLTARYGLPVAGGEWFVFTDWSYRSRVDFFLYQSKEGTGKGMTIGGLRSGYDWDDGKYEVAAYVRNLTNQIRVTGAIDFNNETGFINDPRTWGVQFKATF